MYIININLNYYSYFKRMKWLKLIFEKYFVINVVREFLYICEF